ncbi:MAG: hypothetical protein ABWY28_16605 [Pseudomonas prosekii]
MAEITGKCSMKKLEWKIALVAGYSPGVRLATVRLLVEEGARNHHGSSSG